MPGTRGRALAALAAALAAATGCDRREAAPAPVAAAEQHVAPSPTSPPRGDRHARAAARRPPRVREIAGVVTQADERRVAIRPRAGPAMTLRVGRATEVHVDGVRSSPGALRPGAEVRASYRTGDGGPATAIEIEATGPAAPAAAPQRPPAPPAAAPLPEIVPSDAG